MKEKYTDCFEQTGMKFANLSVIKETLNDEGQNEIETLRTTLSHHSWVIVDH